MRAHFLPGNSKLEYRDSKCSGAALAEVAKFFLFAAFWFWIFCLVIGRGGGGATALQIILGIVFGFFSLIRFNAWQSQRELRQMAWRQWMDRCAAVARQYAMDVDEKHWPWRMFFERGYSPERAVAQLRQKIQSGRAAG